MATTSNGSASNRVAMTEMDLCSWLGQAAPGDTLVYHRGHLASDTKPDTRRISETDRAELKRVARRAAWAAERGVAHLLQRRHGIDDYSYMLVVRARPQSPRGLFTALIDRETRTAGKVDQHAS